MDQSRIRELSLEITDDLYNIGKGYVKHKIIFEFFSKFFRPRMINIIKNEIPEDELKKIMWNCKGKLDKMFKMMDKAEDLKDSKFLNSPEMTKKLMLLPDFAELERLL